MSAPTSTAIGHVSIRFSVVSIFIVGTALIAVLAIGLQYYFGSNLAKDAASDLYAQNAADAAGEIVSFGDAAANVAELLSIYPELAAAGQDQAQVQLFAMTMLHHPLFYGVYVARGDGTFHELINLDNVAKLRDTLLAAPDDRWVAITVEGQGYDRQRRYDYLDEDLVLRATRSEPTDFDVLSRPWYVAAMNEKGVQNSGIYQFSQLKASGQTISNRVSGTATVLGIDMTLSSMSAYLSKQMMGSEALSVIYKLDGQVITSSLNQHAPVGTSGVSRAPVSGQLESVAGLSLLDIANSPRLHGQLVEVEHNGEAYFAFAEPLSVRTKSPYFFGILVPEHAVVGAFMDKVILSVVITAGFLLLLSPLSWFFATPIVRPIRQLADENDKVRQRRYNSVQRVSSRVKEVDELSESMVSMVSAIQAHELNQRKLMDSFIELIAQAIDDKSAYTGGHCARVPELAFMLAAQASSSDAPAFEDFKLETDDQWREYRIAAWLHDCGKITVPEHIVDKGTKLETIYNRIHEVRMRFEVLWRDAQIKYWQGLNERPTAQAREEQLSATLHRDQQQLLDEFAFVAECNVGGEFLDDGKRARLVEISRKTWVRHFDNRLGLSPVEELRGTGATDNLPATEQLLSDRPEHMVERTRSAEYAPELGINMDVPEYLYNLGELYNLSISRGTLTAEDRFKINEHMITTIRMLEGLPFPEELKNVPRYASTHHETMSGLGYPRKLRGEQLSVPERILAVADVFEALTASDRPYKKAKAVSVAIDILHKMVLDNHIDKDCFELFVSSKVYVKYAEAFLAPEQRDAVDESKYIS